MAVVCINGKWEEGNAPLLPVSNRAFKYGDGVFETMLVNDGVLQNADLHFQRLHRSLDLLTIDLCPNNEQLEENISRLCEKNNFPAAKVRLTVYRDHPSAGYVIEGEAINPDVQKLNEKGWSVGIHPFVRKGCDAYANIKSVSFLPYVMADTYRKEKQMDECIVLNAFGNIADGSRTNIFLIKEDEIITPALHQGCIDGVMRKWVIDGLKKQQRIVKQTEVSVEILEKADAVFLTNAVRGIKWVESFGETKFRKGPVEEISNLIG